MRRLVVAMMVAGAAQAAQAADLPDFSALRGPVGISRGVVNWQGFYAGGQAGYGSADMNFSSSNSAMIAQLLANTNIENEMNVSSWPLLGGKTNTHQSQVGGFVGYNSQWDDVVLGVEANYMHGTFSGASVSAPVSRGMLLTSDSLYHIVTVNSSKSISISDMGTIRARAGYVWGNFMPYVFGGAALGRGNIYSAVSVSDQKGADSAAAQAATPVTLSASDGISGKMLYGYTAGLGTEVMLFGNVFARAEWEYIRFVNAGADVNINTVRGGLGYKF
ncbi:Opacity protein antigens [Afipia felis]|uniref:Opacity protein antigens n=1 Tax=Afipia felis TaxID=1035 RepID=A0A090MPF8_AFIFE|nr:MULTISPECIES: outer membrane beta-barrel protein [Afipia]EFI51248.1 porin [Afipia sp. 1NLS2]CEG09260.1 Opacity protein antigens [Afipia felis]